MFRAIPVFLKGSPWYSLDKTDEIQRNACCKHTQAYKHNINVSDHMNVGKEKDISIPYFYIDSLGREYNQRSNFLKKNFKCHNKNSMYGIPFT